MRGLLLKDIYTLTKQIRILIVLLVFLSVVSGYSASSFAVVYAAMLPVTALAYDERSKWNTLATMMPYSAKSIVLSKYILGYLSVGCAAVLSIIVQIAISLVKKVPLEPEGIVSVLMVVCVATVMQAVNLPFMFKLGVEKGRLVFFVLVAAIVVGGTMFGDQLVGMLSSTKVDFMKLSLATVVGTVLINIVSIGISIGLYKKDNRL